MLNSMVSVIIPIYNSEKYLPMCIESIVSQTYKNLEILLIDDGSTDNSLKICYDYAERDTRIRVFHQSNKGVSAARNIGIVKAQGDYITFVDSDDELLQNAIYLLVQDIELFNADIATAAKIYITINNEEKTKSFEDTSIKSNVVVFSNTEPLIMSLDFDRRMTACHGMLFRKQFLSDIRYEEGRRINEDFYFIFLCCLKQPILTYHNECVYKYYYRGNSASRAVFGDKYFDMIYFSNLKKQMIKRYYPELLDKAICMEVSTHLFLLNLLWKTKDKKYLAAEEKSVRFVIDNYKKYITKNKFEKRLSWIVAHGLYPLYKKIMRLKYKI